MTKHDEEIAAVERLRAITRGPKGDRPDYVGTVSTEDATLIVALVDRMRDIYDSHAFGAEEIRYLHRYRALPEKARAELDRYLEYLASRA